MAFFLSVWQAMKEIFKAPFLRHNVWWQLAPVLILWVVLEIYFDRQKEEELGWNTALGNAITLFWLSITGMQQLFNLQLGESFRWGNFWMILIILFYALFVGVISFGHKLGERVTYVMAFPTVVYYFAIFAILWGNKVLDVNKYILIAFFVIWAVVIGMTSSPTLRSGYPYGEEVVQKR